MARPVSSDSSAHSDECVALGPEVASVSGPERRCVDEHAGLERSLGAAAGGRRLTREKRRAAVSLAKKPRD